MTSRATTRLARLLVPAAVAAMMLSALPGHGSTHNLLPNPSFERSVVEPPPPVPPYTNPQPLLPEGWAVEGSAGLFDHSQNDSHSGRRMAAISIPASGKRTTCAGTTPDVCVDDPTTDAKEKTAATYYSLPPAWRTAQAIPVTGGTTYTLSMWSWLSFTTQGEGAVMRVRWLDANGVPIRIDDGPKHVNTTNVIETGWVFKSLNRTAPSNARSAVILLSHTTDLWLGQIRFDDVYFG